MQGSTELLPHDNYMEMVVFFKVEGQLAPNYYSKNKITVLEATGMGKADSNTIRRVSRAGSCGRGVRVV